MSAGEVGCALSHVRLWRLFAESSQDDDDLALILEDDAALVPDFAARVSAAWESGSLQDCGMIYCGFSHRGERRAVPLAGLPSGENGSTCAFVPTLVFTTHCYFIRSRTAKALLNALPVRGPLDCWLSQIHWAGERVLCLGVEGAGWKGQEPGPLADQLGRFKRDSDVPRSSRGEAERPRRGGGRGGRGGRWRAGRGRGT